MWENRFEALSSNMKWKRSPSPTGQENVAEHWLWNHIILDSVLACSLGTYSVAWVLELNCSKSRVPYLLNKGHASKGCCKEFVQCLVRIVTASPLGLALRKMKTKELRSILWCLLPVFMSMYDGTEMAHRFFRNYFLFFELSMKYRGGLGRKKSDGATMRRQEREWHSPSGYIRKLAKWSWQGG